MAGLALIYVLFFITNDAVEINSLDVTPPCSSPLLSYHYLFSSCAELVSYCANPLGNPGLYLRSAGPYPIGAQVGYRNWVEENSSPGPLPMLN